MAESDGKEIFFVRADNRQLAVAVAKKGRALELAETRQLFGPITELISYEVAADGKHFLMGIVQEYGGTSSFTLSKTGPR